MNDIEYIDSILKKGEEKRQSDIAYIDSILKKGEEKRQSDINYTQGILERQSAPVSGKLPAGYVSNVKPKVENPKPMPKPHSPVERDSTEIPNYNSIVAAKEEEMRKPDNVKGVKGERTALHPLNTLELEDRGKQINAANDRISGLSLLQFLSVLGGATENLRNNNSNGDGTIQPTMRSGNTQDENEIMDRTRQSYDYLESLKQEEENKLDEAKDLSSYSKREQKEAYDNIGNYNLFERILDKDKRGLYAVKQQMVPAYNEVTMNDVFNKIVNDGNYENFVNRFVDYDKAVKIAIDYHDFSGQEALIPGRGGSNQYFEEMQNDWAEKNGYSIEELNLLADYMVKNNMIESAEELATEHPVAASALSPVTNLVGGLEGAYYGLSSGITGNPIDSNSKHFNLQDYTGTIRDTVSDSIESDVGKFAYGTGMSIADSLLAQVAGGGKLGTTLMGMNSYSQTLQEGAERGLTPAQMQTTALTAGAFEYAFEQISWDRVKLIAKGEASPNILINALTQSATEGMEEIGTETANILVDNLVNGGAAEMVQLHDFYISQGMSEEEAEKKVFTEYAKQLGMSFAGGAVSGGVMGGGASVYNRVTGNNHNNIIEQSIQNEIPVLQSEPEVNPYEQFSTQMREVGLNPDGTLLQPSGESLNGNVENTLSDENMSANEEVHTPEQLRIMDEYANSVDNDVIDFVNDVRAGENVKPLTVAIVSDIAATEIQRLTGKEVYGNRVVLDSNGVRHIDKRHGINGIADQSMADDADLARIEYVLNNYDTVNFYGDYAEGYVDKNGKNAPIVVFEKRIDGSYYVVEAVSDAKTRKNYIVSAYKTKAVNQSLDARAPQDTSENAAENTAFVTNSIPNPSENVNASSYTSRTATNTFKNSSMFKNVEQNLEMLQGEIDGNKLDVDKVTEQQSLREAAENLDRDYEGTVAKLESNEEFTGVDTDEAMMIMERKLEEAKQNGDYVEVKRWMRVIVDKAHHAGQALQAFAKYSRTAEGTLVKGEAYLKKQVDQYVKNNPKGAERASRTAEDIWSELESVQKSLDALNPIEEPGTYKPVRSQIESAIQEVLKRDSKKHDKKFTDHIVDQLAKGIDEARLNEEILTYTATGFFGLSDEDVEQVISLFDEAEKYGDFSKQRYDLEQQAIAIIAQRVTKADFMDKWNAWRYLSMLGNSKTHIRNMIGNSVFGMVTGVKNNVAAIIEASADKFSKNGIERTKSVLNPLSEIDQKLIKAGKKDAVEGVYTLLTDGGNKYNMANEIERNKPIYNTKFLEKIRHLNDNMLDKEDFSGLRNKYATSLAGYLKSHGADSGIFISKSEGDIRLLNNARTYAIEQAKIATFHEYNALASELNNFSQNMKNKGGVVGTGTHMLMEGLLPFKKTPSNIAKQGIKYSPISILTGVYQMVHSVNTGRYTASQAIDTLSQGLTGTGIMALGIALASLGLITGAPDDDDKKSSFDTLTGSQNYALKIGDKSYPIDWLAPFALPLFAGVSLQEQYNDTGKISLMDALASLSEPMLEMSMLQGINDTLESVRYGEEGKAIQTIVSNTASNYISQGIPTLFGQVARSIDDTRRSTYTGKTGIANQVGRAINTAENKIPFLSMTNQPYVDSWGRTQENIGGNILGRLAYNMFSPGYYSEVNMTPIDNEVQHLYALTGESGVLPPTANSSITYNGEQIKLTPEEYTKYATVKGQTQFDMINKFMASDMYDKLTDYQKVDVVKSIYTAASNISQNELGYPTADQKIYGIYNDYGQETLINYLMAKKIADGSSISDIMPVLDNMSLSNDENGYLLQQLYNIDNTKGAQKALQQYGNEGVYDYYSYKSEIDTNNDSYFSQDEVIGFLNVQTDLSQSEKADWFDIYCPTAKNNPFRIDSAESEDDIEYIERILSGGM